MQPMVDRKLLENMTVLELTESQAGATCTQTLAWMGANVIKVEPVNTGEPGRHAGKPTGKSADGVFFYLHNTSKKSITLNIQHAEGRVLFAQLVAKADVVVDNLKPGNFSRLGWSYELLQEANPSIIYATISGFGEDGPYSEYPATEAVAEALGGGFGTTGFPGMPPTMPGNYAGESGAGLHAALAILAAFADRMDTGRTHHVDVSMQDTVMNLIRTRLWMTYHTGNPYPRVGNRLATVPGGTYPCKPGGPNDYVFVFVHYNIPAMWDGCLRAMQREDLIGDERYRATLARLDRREEVEKIFTDWSMSHTKYEVLEALGRQGVPCGAVLDTADLMENEHFKQRNMVVEVDHPEYGPMQLLGCPIKVSDGPITFEPAPLLGADNDNIYGSLLDLSAERRQELRDQGVI
ncbi:MAG: CoA transferase [bacterium]|nr:CoA transferase [bacterium]